MTGVSHATGHGENDPHENANGNRPDEIPGEEYGDVAVADWYIEAIKYALASIIDANEQGHMLHQDGSCLICGQTFVVLTVPTSVMADAMRINNMTGPVE